MRELAGVEKIGRCGMNSRFVNCGGQEHDRYGGLVEMTPLGRSKGVCIIWCGVARVERLRVMCRVDVGAMEIDFAECLGKML